MSTDVIWQTDCSSLEQSLALAVQLGKQLKGSEVIELVSDLGGGKTTFVKGLAKGIGSNDTVSSPTFTISNMYQGQNITMHHFDFYRLLEPGIMREELAEIIDDPMAVTVIEWAGIVEDVLPADRLTITIGVTSEQGRAYTFKGSSKYAQLVEALKR